jgi:outer membrane receptor protein involved in Fe transport
MPFLFFCLFLFTEDREVEVLISEEASQEIDQWTLVLDGNQAIPFGENGKLSLPEESIGNDFTIKDGSGQTRFFGLWSNHPENPLKLQIGEQVMFEKQVVSANRVKESAWRVPGEISVVRPEDQPERAVMQTSDWLKEEAEVLIQKTNLGGGSPVIRGMSGNRVLMMVDGFRLNNATYRLGLNQYLNTVPGGMLDQIEVLSGPTGVQYGSDGLGGTVHLRSADPADQKPGLGYQGSLSSSDGSNSHRLSGNTHVGLLSIAGHFQTHRYEDLKAADPVDEQNATGFEAWDSSLNLTYRVNDHSRLRMINQYSRADDVPRTDRILSGRDLLWNYNPQIQQFHGLRWETTPLNKFADRYDVGVAYMRQEEGTERISSSRPERQTNVLNIIDTFQANATFDKVLGKWRFVYGIDGQWDAVDSSGERIDVGTGETVPDTPKFPSDAAYESFGAFVSGTIATGEDHNLRLGLRQTWVSLEGTLTEPIGFVSQSNSELTPSAAWTLDRGNWLWSLNVSQGFRAPNLEDALAIGPANGGFDAPNPNLEPENLWSYETTFRWRTQRSLIEFSGYTSRYEDLMEKVPGTYLGSPTFDGEPVSILDNVGEARVDGASIAFQQYLGKRVTLRTDAAYTHGTATDTDQPMRRIPPFRGNLKLTWQHARWIFASHLTWADRQDRLSPGDIRDNRIPDDGTPGYGALHLRSRYQINDQIAINLALENVTDKLYRIHGSGIFEPGRRLFLELSAAWR